MGRREIPQWDRATLSTVDGQLEAQREILESIQAVVDSASAKRAALLKSAFEWACALVAEARREEADELALDVARRTSAASGDDWDDVEPPPAGHA